MDDWETLVAERERLVRTLARRCGNGADAEDWAHDAIIKVATAPGVDRQRVCGLLSVVAWRIAVDGLRARRRHERIAATLSRPPPPTPDDIAVEHRVLEEMAEYVAALPPRERDVFTLVAAGMPLAEACNRLKVSYKAAESALARARARLRRRVSAIA